MDTICIFVGQRQVSLMIGKQIEDRVEFSAELRKKVLQKTRYRCASCGDKLDMVRHTIDHIVPISRGGTNDIENLIGLCKVCNEYKNNIVYFPGDYYTYLMITDSATMGVIHRHVVKYLKKEVHNFDLHRYPVISPCSTAMLYCNGIIPKTYTRQLLFDIVYMQSDMRKANSAKVNFLKDYPYYAVIKRTTQKMISILRIDYDGCGRHKNEKGKSMKQLTVFDEWNSSNPKIIAPLIQNVSGVIASRYVELGIPIDQVCMASTNPKVPDIIYNMCLTISFGWFKKPVYVSLVEGLLNDREELGYMNYCCIDIDFDEEDGNEDEK